MCSASTSRVCHLHPAASSEPGMPGVCGWQLAEVSAGRRQLLCQKQVPVSYSCCVILHGDSVQTNRQRQLLASKPSRRREHRHPGQGSRIAQRCRDRLAPGQTWAAWNRWLFSSDGKEARGGSLMGWRRAESLKLSISDCALQFLKTIDASQKRKEGEQRSIYRFKCGLEPSLCFLSSRLFVLFPGSRGENAFQVPTNLQASLGHSVHGGPTMSLALCQVLLYVRTCAHTRTHTVSHNSQHSSGKLFLLLFGLFQFNNYLSVSSARLGGGGHSCEQGHCSCHHDSYVLLS